MIALSFFSSSFIGTIAISQTDSGCQLIRETLKYWVGVQQGLSYLMERRCLVGHPSNDGAMIKMHDGVDGLHQPASHIIFLIGLVKTESSFIVRSVETGLRR